MLSRTICFFGALSYVAAFSPTAIFSVSKKRPVVISLSAALAHLDDTNYEQVLSGTVLVDACAPWCGPCKLIEPILEQCAKKWENSLDVVKYDVESKTPDVKIKLLSEGVMPGALPALILFKNGKALAERVGMMTQNDLDEFLGFYLDKPKEKSGAGFVNIGGVEKDDYMLSEYN